MFTAALVTVVRTWKQPRCPSTDEWIKMMWGVCVCMCVCVCNGILLSHKKEWNWVTLSDMDEPWPYQIEVSQKNKLYINTYIWNLLIEKCYCWTYLQGRNRVILRCRELTCEQIGRRRGGVNWDSNTNIYTLPWVKQIASGKHLYKTRNLNQCSVMT